MRLKIEYEGETYDYDPEDLSVKQASKIEKHIWRGSVAAVAAGARVQIEMLAQQSPGTDLGALRQSVDDLIKMCENTGAGTLLDWEIGLARGRSDCLQALAWIAFHGGRLIPIDEVEVKVVKLANAFRKAQEIQDAAEREKKAGQAQDPTGLPGQPLSPPPEGIPLIPANGKAKSREHSAKG